jgi:sulfoxide reductase catalytic subunit YedY
MKKRQNLGNPIPSSEITPKDVYMNRRQFMKAAGFAAAGALLAACTPQGTPEPLPEETEAPPAALYSDELMDPATSFEAITNYNNYYEFTVDKERVAKLAKNFTTTPWQVEVGGLVNKPRTFSLEDILALHAEEERVYRMRCVEGWSMVIPWLGFPLSALLKAVEPMGNAKYVGFETIMRPEEMPGLKDYYPWPYLEGLRLDEAMHDLTILSTGLYGERLLPQNGAPLRLVVPWKYGFKSIKSIVRIDLLEEQPPTFWNMLAPDEYGFYSNVNPKHAHPRWSQATERRIGENMRRPTLMFNGYEEQVASLYSGMDLDVYY